MNHLGLGGSKGTTSPFDALGLDTILNSPAGTKDIDFDDGGIDLDYLFH